MDRNGILLLFTGKKHLLQFAAGCLSILILLIFWLFLSPVAPGGKSVEHIIKIKQGSSFGQIVDSLQSRGIVENRTKFTLVARLSGLRKKIKAGKYRFESGTSSYELLKILAEGKESTELVTIPEGKTAAQIAGILHKRVEIDSTEFMAQVNDSSLCKKLGIPANSVEGFLYPETYRFSWGMLSTQIITTMVNQFYRQFNDSLRSQIDKTGFTLLGTVTLASIIEGEAVVDSERTLISAVYHNRLKRGMALQADPTIQYIISDGPRRLRKRDLKIDSPYNTYLYPGLPPGPICNPGLSSLKAALYPAKVKYLYFVATGDGSHTFSKTYSEHLRAKAKFDRIRKQIARSKSKG